MPFKYKPKEGSARRSYSPDRMRLAVESVVNENNSTRGAAIQFGIDRKTLSRYVHKYRSSDNKEAVSMSPKYNSCQIFSADVENLLENYLIHCSKLNYGLSAKAVRSFVYQFAIKNQTKIPDSWQTNKSAGYDWLRGFMSRHKKLSLRQPEATSLSRSTAFNKTNVEQFFSNLREALSAHTYGPENIYNIDETGVTTVHKPGKIIAIKGEKQVARVTSGERGKLVTMCSGISAIGTFIPPFFIFPRKRVTPAMTKGAPVGSVATAYPSGWMTQENFEIYMKHFIRYSRASKANKCLVILDNHESHISPNVIDICRDNGITLVTLPPHTSHRLQPLDKGVFGPFKTFYNQAADDYMVTFAGDSIKIQDIPALVGIAFPKAFTPTNIQKGFSSTGIYPFNSTIFTDDDFLGAYVTDRPFLQEITASTSNKNSVELPNTSTNSEDLPSTSNNNSEVAVDNSKQTKTPKINILSNEVICTPVHFSPNSSLTNLIYLPEDVRPFPKAPPRKATVRGRKKRCSLILTTTPNKEKIMEEYNLRMEKKNKSKTKNIEQIKRKIECSDDENETPVLSQKKIHRPTKRQAKKDISSSETESELPSDFSDADLDHDCEDFPDEQLSTGDFCLVKFCTKATIYHYVGRVINRMPGREYEVTFLRRVGEEYLFIYPTTEDTAVVPENDITIKLPQPISRGGTERAVLKISFDFDFTSFSNIK